MGQDRFINVALAPGFANGAPRHKGQRTRGRKYCSRSLGNLTSRWIGYSRARNRPILRTARNTGCAAGKWSGSLTYQLQLGSRCTSAFAMHAPELGDRLVLGDADMQTISMCRVTSA